MKKFDWNRSLPAGIRWEEVRQKISLGLGFAGVWSLGILYRYLVIRSSLFYTSPAGKVEIFHDARMPAFDSLVYGLPLAGFGCYFGAMLLAVGYFYLYHRMGSMSVYLMRRLPNRWELHRRCWTVPVLGALAGLVLLGMLLGVYYLIYRFCTPAQCLL